MSGTDKKNTGSFNLGRFKHPRYWLPLFSVGLILLATRLPYTLQMRLGSGLGRLLYYILRWRRIVAETNTELVFPEFSPQEKKQFVKANFRSMGMSLFETALCWWGKDEMLRPLVEIEGLENLTQALGKGKGVILLSAHFTCLEIGGRLLSLHHPFFVTYKSSKNPMYEAVLKQSREKHFTRAIERHDVRSFIKSLKENNPVWYAPDQDFGKKQSVFVPFMGVMTATLTAPARIAKMSGAQVVPFFPRRLDNNKGYKLTILPALDNYPVGNEEQDAHRINQIIEQQVKKTPEQYLWVHCRFKTRPDGEPPVYPLRKRLFCSTAKGGRREFSRSPADYRLVLYLLALPVMLYTLWFSIRFRDLRYFVQRMGFNYPVIRGKTVWLHMASVGEASAAVPLLNLLLESDKRHSVLVTTFTVTGEQFLSKKYGKKLRHAYLPADYPVVVNRFINACNPQCAFIMETELWPTLVSECRARSIPVVVFNGRLSSKTLNTGSWMRKIYGDTLEKVTSVLARSEDDRSGFITLGADEEQVKVVGNIKFAYEVQKPDPQITALIQRPYVLAASTRKNEEILLLQAWTTVDKKEHLLVIAPRHPQRLDEILKQTNVFGLKVAVRSRQDPVEADTDVYIADTLGELASFMASAEFVFMGGSLVPLGGHNIIEPANYGKAIVFGPHMENFAEEARVFLDNNAALQVDHAGLAQCFKELLDDTDRCKQLGDAAMEIAGNNRGIARRYLDELSQYFS